MESFTRQGKIYVIKHDGVYLFLLEGKKLYILCGGKIQVAEHELSFYVENLPKYHAQIKKAFAHYDAEVQRMAQEIKKLGGLGRVHGCIIDIDGWNHIYCDPHDGTVSFYYATDIVNKWFYKDFRHLVNESPSLFCRALIQKRLEDNNYSLNLLTTDKSASVSAVPEIVLDTKMYDASRKMRSVQYELHDNVIRLWNDSILDYDFDKIQLVADNEKQNNG